MPEYKDPEIPPTPELGTFEERFTKAVLDVLGHSSPTMALLRQEWLDGHRAEATTTEAVTTREEPSDNA